MLYYSDRFPVKDIRFYHDSEEKKERIRQRGAVSVAETCPHCGQVVSGIKEEFPSFADLKADIQERGIIEPVHCRNFGSFIQIETGEQRLLIANDLGIETVKAFIRSPYDMHGDVRLDTKIATTHGVIVRFQDPDCPTCQQILKYIERGLIKL